MGSSALNRAASVAAWIVLAAMLIHNLNALYLEPTYLGFVDKAKDYADMAKIENALWSFSFTSSGTAHIFCGFALMLIGLASFNRFRAAHADWLGHGPANCGGPAAPQQAHHCAHQRIPIWTKMSSRPGTSGGTISIWTSCVV